MRFAFYTLGCKVNQYETQAMESALVADGHTLTEFDAPADAYIINTCTVTAVSDKKSRQAIRRARRLNPAAVVAVCGCYAQTKPEEIAALGVDLVSGTDERMEFLRAVEQAALAKAAGPIAPLDRVGPIRDCRTFEALPAGGLEGRTRAMLKVEDGCLNFCSYCIIPYARGPVRSLPLETAVEQAKDLAQAGYREIVLTGIEISSWGRDLPEKPGLAALIEAVCLAAPELRVRLGSLEPRTITEEFCRRLAPLPNLCPHFHLSLQSGCDATLKRMNRKYTTQRYLESCRLLRAWFPAPAITTDLIVGFPGETEEEFSATLDFIRQCAFSAMHIFPYSPRTGTPAAKMPGQVPPQVKEDRAHRAAAAAAELEQHYLAACVGQTFPVLFEEERGGLWHGHAPNYTEVVLAGQDLHNRVLPVEITGAENGCLTGRVLA